MEKTLRNLFYMNEAFGTPVTKPYKLQPLLMPQFKSDKLIGALEVLSSRILQSYQ
jgi:hypothetical protein